MINLFDYYTLTGKDLHFSLLVAGFHQPTVVIHDDGFLPDDVTSPLQYFLTQAGERLVGKSRYFNQIKLPRFWELEADGAGGKIMDKGVQRGRITYTSNDNSRLVKTVEWWDFTGQARVVDHYNQWGFKHAQTILNEQGQATITTYLTRRGKEVLVHNHLTGTWTYWQPDGRPREFANEVDLVEEYLRHAEFKLDTINFNSLSTPLFVIQRLLDRVKLARLFWQEALNDEVPGNMTFMLAGNLAPAQVSIMVQTQKAYQRLKQQLPMEQKKLVHYLGYAYPFQRLNQEHQEILILTNSDQLVQIESLVQGLSDFHFSIAALTEMSSRLLALDRYENVDLYPTVTTAKVRELVAQADVYLDINRGNEILDAVRAAFENNMLIVGFHETLHAPRYVALEHRFDVDQVPALVALIKHCFADGQLEPALQKQWQAADRVLPAAYRQALLGKPGK